MSDVSIRRSGAAGFADLAAIPGLGAMARPRFLERLADATGARRAYLSSIASDPRAAISGAVQVTLNHGGIGVTRALRVSRSLGPLIGADRRRTLRRKELSIYANLGDHQRVLDLTETIGPGEVSTVRLMRAMS